ncbi:AlbA family DNA-binding domain-containing protein [Sunxiuqinia sp. A32]|uniref:AlbA family DNA-binding domain-containing protein n=1 Tax=Sunxiuqinia sp. A32 TaxID=3461496 RepID=UPI0040456CE5
MSYYLSKLILEGEHQGQDFKYCINDSKKIARSLVAFANTDGGRLLIGVKDNGNIAGVRSEEEYYMIEAAAKIYSKPEINFDVKQHLVDGKTVLEVTIDPSQNKPHFAKDEDGKWLAYFRQHDENRLANKVLIDVWRKQNSKKGIFIQYSKNEKFLLDYLEKNESISLSAFSRKVHITLKDAGQIISDFIVLGILDLQHADKKIKYKLADQFNREEWEKKQNLP